MIKSCTKCGVSFESLNGRATCSKECQWAIASANSYRRWAGAPSIVERLEKYRIRRGEDECWGWTGFAHRGYGRLRTKTGVVGAHRVAYEAAHGPIPNGLTVLHMCDNPGCTNPRHLRLGTNADNNADRDAKGRQARGERSGRAILTEQKVLIIRASRLPARVLGEVFGCSKEAVVSARNGRSWAHLPMNH